ncbi:unnamed protein product [Pseudo-nitzschia multistriata]|uniref:Uncharacterized protein n=1 Tax=Pseudo-nitzschia multistriata TaxID=183589 RepID=A0A448ZLC8_9STRA|nr:unnamed protein product [Pseudo-nitzschia multistriata]
MTRGSRKVSLHTSGSRFVALHAVSRGIRDKLAGQSASASFRRSPDIAAPGCIGTADAPVARAPSGSLPSRIEQTRRHGRRPFSPAHGALAAAPLGRGFFEEGLPLAMDEFPVVGRFLEILRNLMLGTGQVVLAFL